MFWSYCLYKTIKSPKLIIHSFYHHLWVITSYYELLRVSSNFSYNGFCADCQLYCLQRNCSSKAAGHPMWRMFALESSNMHRYVSYVSMLLLFLIFQVTTYLLIKHFYLRIFFSFNRNNPGCVPSSSSGWRWHRLALRCMYRIGRRNLRRPHPLRTRSRAGTRIRWAIPSIRWAIPGRPKSCWHQFRLQLQRRYLRNSGAVFEAGTSQTDR